MRSLGWAVTLALATVAAAALNRLLRDDPGLRRAMVAPEDDEPVTAEDRAAIHAARERIRRGFLVPRWSATPPRWAIYYDDPVDNELATIADDGERQAVDRAIVALPDGDVERLKDPKMHGAYRMRVGDWRVLFMMNRLKRTITVVRVAARESAYEPLPSRVKRWSGGR